MGVMIFLVSQYSVAAISKCHFGSLRTPLLHWTISVRLNCSPWTWQTLPRHLKNPLISEAHKKCFNLKISLLFLVRMPSNLKNRIFQSSTVFLVASYSKNTAAINLTGISCNNFVSFLNPPDLHDGYNVKGESYRCCVPRCCCWRGLPGR